MLHLLRASLLTLALTLPLPAFAANPLTTLTLPATTTAYTAGQLMATSATGTSVVVPKFYIQAFTGTGSVLIFRGRLQINDTLASSWNGQTITIDFWDVAPTFAAGSGDRSTFNPATGTANHHGSLTCTLGLIYGDGVYGDCTVANGNAISWSVPSGQQVYWTATATTGSGTVTASDVVGFTPEIIY